MLRDSSVKVEFPHPSAPAARIELVYYATENEIEKLISAGVRLGIQKALEAMGEKPKHISQSKAWKTYGKGRVQGWVAGGLLKRKPGGGGKTSTVLYEVARLMELDARNAIVIRKNKF